MKSPDKELVKQSSLEQKSILRHRDADSETVENEQGKADKGILKHPDPLLAEIKSVLRESSPEKTTSQRSILKKESSFEAKQTEPEKGVLKKTLSSETSTVLAQETEEKLDVNIKCDTEIEKEESKDSTDEVEESKVAGDDTDNTPSSDKGKSNVSSKRRFRDRKDRTNER